MTKHYPSKNTQGKLSYDDVREIRKIMKRPKSRRPTLKILGELYGVGHMAISDIARGVTYRYLDDKE